jgi:uncharacterized repeat protein (TIGR02543 family)
MASAETVFRHALMNMKLLVQRCWWLALAVLAACFSPQFNDGEIQCGPSDECPPGLSCFAGLCRTGDPGVDAAVGFPLTITLGGNMMGTVTSAPAGIDCGSDCSETFPSGSMVTLTATAMSGSTFVGWSGACSGTGTCTITVATAVNVTASFGVDNSLVVALSGNGSGIVSSNPAGINCGNDCSEVFAPDTMVTLTASPATGSSFDGWSGAGCTGTGTCTLTTDVAKMVTATFSLTQHSLGVVIAGTGSGDVTSTPGGIDCGENSDCNESYPYNTMVTLTAAPAAGSTFAGWSGGVCTGTGTCQVTMTQAASVTATFDVTTHVLAVTKAGNGNGTVTSSPAGINCGTGAGCMSSFDYNTAVTLSATPAAGSTFTGWTGGGCTGTGPCEVTMTAATNITATFTLNKHALGVLKDGNGSGTVTSNPAGIACGGDCTEDYNYNTVVSLTQAPSPGSTFTGWSGACSGVGACSVTLDAAKTVTATFTLTQHTLDVVLGGTGTGTVTGVGIDCHAQPNADCNGTYNYGALVTLTATPAAGSAFAGWSGASCTGTGTCEVTMTQARTVTAQFTLNTYLLSVTPSGTGAGTVTSNIAGIDCGSDCGEVYGHGTAVTLTAAPATGSVFSGWTGCTTTSGATCNVTMNATKSVTATFTITTPTLTATIAGGGNGTVTSNIAGIDCPGDCSNPYNYGTVVTLTATPSAGSTFTGWSGTAGCTGASTSCQVTVDAAKTATATFALATSGLTVAKTGTGAGTVTSGEGTPLINCGQDCFEDYPNNTTVTLTAAPSPGSTFSGWSGAAGCTTNPTCNVTVTTAMTVSATFTLDVHTLSVSRNGTGTGTVVSNEATPLISCGTDCSEPYNHGTVVTLTATPAANATFVGWSGGGCSGTGNCVVTVDAAKTVTATFDLVQHALRVKAEAGGTVTSMPMGINCGADCDELYNDGQVVMLLATADPGYTFVGWQDDCTGPSTMCSVTMDGKRGVYAAFAPVKHTLTIVRNPDLGGDVYSIDDAGIDCGKTCNSLYDYGTKVPLKVSPASGYTFTGWSGACTGTGDCAPTMDADKTVTANFVLTTYTLTVNHAGNGMGTVVSNESPPKIDCGKFCDATYNAGSMVTLTASVTTGTTFGGWSGCTSASGTTCNVTMNAAKSVTATFNLQTFNLTVQKSGTGAGTVTSSPGGINCGATCVSSFNYNTAVALTAAASAGSSFTSWSGCASTNGTTCNVTMTQARTATATFTAIPANYVFVTSTSHTGALGGLAGADQICQQRASAAGLSGTYRAWLSTTTVNASSRLGAASGWIRRDGRPVVNTVADLTSGHLFYPPRLDELGNDVGNATAFTATSSNGTRNTAYTTCSDWTSAASALTAFGEPNANSSIFTGFGAANCSTTRRLYCFGIDNKAAVSPAAVTARRAFMTSGYFIPGGGIAAADAMCASDASAAGLTGTFKALLATTTGSAISRFSTASGTLPWKRLDNTLMAATAAALASPTATSLLASPNSNAANNTWYGNNGLWSGASNLTTVGTAATTCMNWTSAASTSTGTGGRAGFSLYEDLLAFDPSATCNATTKRLMCLEQ